MPAATEQPVKKIYGIDLGSTYSVIAVVNDGKAECIRNQEGDLVTPSAVFYENEHSIVVGKATLRCAAEAPENLIQFIKCEMGKDWKREIHGLNLTPELVSAHIISSLVRDAREVSGHDVQDVVITCPSYFGMREREATRDAGRIAGLNVIAILDEPVAAAFHYGLDKTKGDSAVIVYDLGGRTFDATVLKIENGNIRVVCTDGSPCLGGMDWDERMMMLIAEKFTVRTGINKDELFADPYTAWDLRQQSEDAKKMLTRRDSARIVITYGDHREAIEITLAEFNNITRSLLEETVRLTQKTIDFAKEGGVEKINNFLLVGGSVRMRQVGEMVKAKFASQVDVITEPFEVDEAVAKGAALYGLSERIRPSPFPFPSPIPPPVIDDTIITKSHVLLCASKSYGIPVWNQTKNIMVIANLIQRLTPLPTEVKETFMCAATDAEGAKLQFEVFENEAMSNEGAFEYSRKIGVITLSLPPNMPDKAPVSVTFKLDDQGGLSAACHDATSRVSIPLMFTRLEAVLHKFEIK